MNFFISDLHFGHKNIMSYDDRPFTDIESHDKLIIDNWNNAVNVNDDVYILGDVSWYNMTKTVDILNNLNGIKHLIVGNHDTKLLKSKQFRDCFIETCDYKELYLDSDKSIVLCHYPIPCFKNHYYGWYHLYGHVHDSFEAKMMNHVKREMSELYDMPCHMYNVGCMVPYMKYTSRTLEEILCQNTM